MIQIERDIERRGTPDRPQYFIFRQYGRLPAQKVWLHATTDEDAIVEAVHRCGGTTEDYQVKN